MKASSGIILDYPFRGKCKNVLEAFLFCVLCLVVSRVRLFVTPWTVARQAPLSMGILQARILEWAAMPSSRGSSQTRDHTQVSHIAGGFHVLQISAQMLSHQRSLSWSLEFFTWPSSPTSNPPSSSHFFSHRTYPLWYSKYFLTYFVHSVCFITRMKFCKGTTLVYPAPKTMTDTE